MKLLTAIACGAALAHFAGNACAFTVTPSCFEKQLPETENVMMCSNAQIAGDYIDYGIVSRGCIRKDVKAPGFFYYRNSPVTGRIQTIVKQGFGLNQYFWVVPKRMNPKCRRKLK